MSNIKVAKANMGAWTESGAEAALMQLALDDNRGGNRLRPRLPRELYTEAIAPFMRFGEAVPGQLYAVGGRSEGDGPLATVEMFDTWHGKWTTCPEMAVRRAGCSAVSLRDRRLLVVGGYDERGTVHGLLDSCETFDPDAQTWTSAIAPLRRARWGQGCACVGNFVYVVGGCSLAPGAMPSDTSMQTLRSCEVYDVSTDSWRQIADLCVARAGARVVSLGERHLAVVGGCSDVFGSAEILSSIEVYDFENDRWTLLDEPLSIGRTTAAVAALDEKRILVVGGTPCVSTTEVYSVGGNKGSRAELLSCPAAAGQQESRGLMGCQAVTLNLPAPGESYPRASSRCVVVVGGEEDHVKTRAEGSASEEQEVEEDEAEAEEVTVRPRSSVLVFDVDADDFRPEGSFPPMPTQRAAIALCVAHGLVGTRPW